MINGNDGGATVSQNGGATWTPEDTPPTAQFYHVVATTHCRYRLCGAQQDNTTVCVASRTEGLGITDKDWYDVGGGESGWVAARSDDPDVVFAGSYSGLITRFDRRTGQARAVTAWPDNPMGWGAAALKYRFQWTFPIVLAPTNPNALVIAAQVLFKSTNEGQSWQGMSPDLTRNEPAKQGPPGGPITKDNTSIEYYNTIFTVAPSPRDSRSTARSCRCTTSRSRITTSRRQPTAGRSGSWTTSRRSSSSVATWRAPSGISSPRVMPSGSAGPASCRSGP